MPFPLAVSRRRLLGDGVAAALTVAGAAAVAGCRRSTIPGATEVPRAQSGPWSSTDSLDQTIRLPTRPTRIAAYGDAAAPLINFGVTPVALFPCTDPRQDGTFEGLDLSNVTIIGTTYEEINREELAAAAPELIVTTT